MKVLLLIDALGIGGAERQLALLATSLPDEVSRSVWAITGGQFEAFLQERNVSVTVARRRSRFDVTPALQLWERLIRDRPEVVHSWSWMASLAAAPACRVLGIPLLDGTIRTGEIQKHVLRLERVGLAGANLNVANTHAGLRAWRIPARKGRVVYNGFDWSRVPIPRPAERDPRFTVVMVGRMSPEKDYDCVIEAVRRLKWDPGEAQVLLIGDGDRRRELMNADADLVASGVLRFPDPSIEIMDHVAAADVGVLMTDPSVAKEGCSNAILEYMACGLPVVCGDGGGNPEVVLHEETGFIITPGSPAELAERLAYLRGHPDECRTMGEAGRARVRDRFSIEKMVERFLALYDELSRGRRRRLKAA